MGLMDAAGRRRASPARALDATIVLRSAGERTAELSRALLEAEVGPDQVVVIREVPFSRAVQRTLEIGVQCGRRWTIATDADVLVGPGSIARLVATANRAPDELFALEGRILDKLFGGPRSGGFHLYRTSLLPQAIEFCNPSQPVHRPEFEVIMRMCQQGFVQQREKYVLGVHDFEQSYRDLFRKGFVHAQKHADETTILEPFWTRAARGDADFEAVLLGMKEGRLAGGIATTDVREFGDAIDAILRRAGLAEKTPLSGTDLPPGALGSMMRRRPPPEYRAWYRREYGSLWQKTVLPVYYSCLRVTPRPVRLFVRRILGMPANPTALD